MFQNPLSDIFHALLFVGLLHLFPRSSAVIRKKPDPVAEEAEEKDITEEKEKDEAEMPGAAEHWKS